MVRPSAPRFLNFGDVFELPIVVQNQTDEPLTVNVALETTNLILTEGAGRQVTVPANDRVEVRFPATTDSAGTARFQVAVASGDYADAATIDLPVFTPATTEAFATYGQVDEGAVAQPFVMPDGVIPGFGGLEINTSSTALQALTDAVFNLTTSRYDSSEELASRILAVAALNDVLTAFEADGLLTPDEMETVILGDIETLKGMQNYDGGFPYWERGRDSIPFNSIHVAHALEIAAAKRLPRAARHRRQLCKPTCATLKATTRSGMASKPAGVSAHTRSTCAIWLVTLTPPKPAICSTKPGRGRTCSWKRWAGCGRCWQLIRLYAGDVAEIQQHVNNRAVETAGAANFTTSYGDDDYVMLHSDRRTDGVLLNTLINEDPSSDLIPKVVNGLLAHRNGRTLGQYARKMSSFCWRSTTTSTPLNRKRPTSWRASGWVIPTPVNTPTKAAPPNATKRSSP